MSTERELNAFEEHRTSTVSAIDHWSPSMNTYSFLGSSANRFLGAPKPGPGFAPRRTNAVMTLSETAAVEMPVPIGVDVFRDVGRPGARGTASGLTFVPTYANAGTCEGCKWSVVR